VKFYPEHIVNEAKSLYVNKRMGALRIQRELIKVPEAQGLQISTISKWIDTKGWKKLRSEVAKKTEQKFIENAAEENLKELRIINEALDYIVKDMRKGEVKSNLAEIPNLIKLKMLKRGEHTESLGINEEFDELKQIYDKTRPKNNLVAV